MSLKIDKLKMILFINERKKTLRQCKLIYNFGMENRIEKLLGTLHDNYYMLDMRIHNHAHYNPILMDELPVTFIL